MCGSPKLSAQMFGRVFPSAFFHVHVQQNEQPVDAQTIPQDTEQTFVEPGAFGPVTRMLNSYERQASTHRYWCDICGFDVRGLDVYISHMIDGHGR